MSERRRFIRWQIDKQTKVKLQGALAYANCTICDISFKGIRISLAQKLVKDTFINLSLCLSDDCEIETEVWLVWHKTIDGFNVYGLYFTKIKDQDKEKIYKFVYKCIPSEMYKQWWQDSGEKGGEIMPNGKFEDRRVFARFNAKFPLRILDLRENKESLAQTSDISAKGLGLVVSERISVGTPLEMWLEVPDKGEPLYTRGEVIWTKPVEANKYRIGVNLEKADLMGIARVLRSV